MTSNVKNKKTRRRDGRVKITSQNQISIPVQVMREAGLKSGDRLQASVDESGRVILEAADDVVGRFAGTMPGAFDRELLEQLRTEWDQ